MTESQRSGCPINLALEVIGDKWSLIVIRDIMFGNKRHFRDLLTGSQEGIASNILSDRLRRLTESGLITRSGDASHKQKVLYSLTEPAIQLVPVLVALGSWGRRHRPASRELSVRAEQLETGGPELWEAFMAELRAVHLGVRRPPGSPAVLAELDRAYLAAVAAAAVPPSGARYLSSDEITSASP